MKALALRARIVLRCATGRQNKQVAADLQLDQTTVGKWRRDGYGPKGWIQLGRRTFRCPLSSVIAFEQELQRVLEEERRQWAPPAIAVGS